MNDSGVDLGLFCWVSGSGCCIAVHSEVVLDKGGECMQVMKIL